jgi:hypothetical protein
MQSERLRADSFPQVAFVPLDAILAEKPAKLILEAETAMVTLLIGNVVADLLNVRRG